MSDYEEFERQCEEQREENRKLLKEFAEWLSAKGLSEGTIYKHVTNIDFYINECLLYDDVDTPADGIGAIGYFLGYWFIRKAMWASRRTINGYCAGFKKFYKFMLEKGLVDEEQYQQMLNEIKNDKDEWLDTLRRYDDPDIVDMGEVWGI